MLKILTVIGARPQIIKAAAISRTVKNKFSRKIKEIIVHTGQHYDENMSQVFFEELGIPAPDYHLNAGSGSHGKQIAAMISGIEELLLKEKPACVVLYGDTNSTLAGAVASAKIHIPVVHIEAGLRSFNKSMPEEINRITCDHVSTLLFSPTRAGYENLLHEGFRENNAAPYSIDNPKIYHCGDVMYDNSLYFSSLAGNKTDVLKKNELEPGRFILATIHRDNNTDEPGRMNTLFSALNSIATDHHIKIILPLHPRASKKLEQSLNPALFNAIAENILFKILPPVSFLEMIVLEKAAMMIMTDSGGVQKESYFFKKPCVILRPQTEWVELVEHGTALIADADEKKIKSAFNHFSKTSSLNFPPLFGDGKAAEFICGEMLKHIPA